MAEVTMPRLSDTMSEGAVGRWLKQPGDAIEVGEIIAEIETDKATMELESFESGTLQKIVIPEGQTVPIGEIIAFIGDGSVAPEPIAAPAPAAASAAPASGATATVAAVQTTPLPPIQANGHAERVKASPVARRIAAEAGIDLRLIQGTGPGGRIIKENVEAYLQTQGKEGVAPAPAVSAPAPSPTAAPAPVEPVPAPAGEVVAMSRMRRAIARTMNASKPGTPHIYITLEVDMAAAMQLRQQINESGAAPVKVSVNDLVVKAAAKALHKFPIINSSYATTPDGQPGVVQHQQINIGVAVALDEGLVAPVVTDADKKSVGAIAAEIKDMASRARAGKIKPNELDGGTFQVSNMGMFEVVEFVSIITPPQAASLAVGAVRQTPVVRDGAIEIGEMMFVTISADHRVIDGATAAQYLQELKRLLQSPMSLLV
ncbi:MAG: 2-oxo acid dehydrogenase subunit E2 [Chloroflexales bacterium]|nr:2-oxo acid dehydrogenase subunit E2 [Chloroflexales bacterium]